MANTENIQKLFTTSVKRKIPLNPKDGEEQIELEFHKLSFAEQIKYLNFSDSKTANIKPAIARTLRISESEVDSISMEYIADITEVVLDINTRDKEKRLSEAQKMKEFLDERKI
jgi:hypothetical protein